MLILRGRLTASAAARIIPVIAGKANASPPSFPISDELDVVVLDLTGRPQERVKVEVIGVTGLYLGQTDGRGRASIQGLPPGTYTVRLGECGWDLSNEKLEVNRDQTVYRR